MLSSLDSANPKHPIVFADALIPREDDDEKEAIVASPTNKTLPLAVGPKGKLVNIVLPSPLSPARYPYGQEGPAVGDALTSPIGRRETSASGEGGALKWATQQKPLKPREEEKLAAAATGAMGVVAKLPEGKGVITVGGMSLAQAKAQAAAEEEARRNQPPPQPTPSQRIISSSQQAQAPVKSILTTPDLHRHQAKRSRKKASSSSPHQADSPLSRRKILTVPDKALSLRPSLDRLPDRVWARRKESVERAQAQAQQLLR